MDLFKQGLYEFKYFNEAHINSLLVCLLIGFIMILIPFIFKNIEKGKYTKILGYIMIGTKIFDSLYRAILEHEPIYSVMPFNLCNMALLISGLYLITRKNIYFNILYFWFSGAILAVLLPGVDFYYTKFYIYSFMGAHVFEIFAVLYGFIHLDETINKRGLKISILLYILFSVFTYTYNLIFGTNFMFMNDYIIPAASIIKPMWLYRIALTGLFVSSMVLMYLPFKDIDNEKVEEEIFE